MTKIYALFLPQFHADPYNDRWWGKGFTEWNNVQQAQPLFVGHDQPRAPRDGYQMLETAADLEAQFNEARSGGLDGFVFYHYWSKGTRLLKKPLDILLDNPQIAQGSEFSLCWANHSWTRSWKNRSGAMDVLLEQTYEITLEEMYEHVDFLVGAFSDPRYARVGNEPVFFIYRPEEIPNLPDFVSLLQNRCHERLGHGCHISAMITNWRMSYDYLTPLDSATLTQPAAANNAPVDVFETRAIKTGLWRNPKYLARALPNPMKRLMYSTQDLFFNRTVEMDYDACWEKVLSQIRMGLSDPSKQLYFGGFVDFDNTARYGKRARYYSGFTPEKFATYLKSAFDLVQSGPNPDFFLINAWNEWAEGMYLQPDTRYGDARLDAVRALHQP